MTTVAILGCGYVGLALGERLLTAETVDRVVGVRRSDSGVDAMEAAGIDPIQGDITTEKTLSALPDVEAVVFAASVGRSSETTSRELYVEGQKSVLDHLRDRETPPERYIYTSSTGVYGDHSGDWVDEATPIDPETERQQTLADAEAVARERADDIATTVVRFAGLYGPDRYRLERYLDGPVTEGILNLTHREDAAGALAFVLGEEVARNEVLLAVDDEPVSKWELADWLAESCGESVPPKQTKAERLADESLSTGARQRIEADKRCQNEKLRSLGYDLQYPTFREGYQAAVDAYTATDKQDK
ncbi:SDR family oxidoreductase [Halovenus salina]|uniref:SDR family oxidoreductase n=1 Tax=Halovenus salina TaxID=1510225 RepID=A0ABD5W4P3_9EURY|nr:SDR family oxidoreductase [Halovenus salina]